MRPFGLRFAAESAEVIDLDWSQIGYSAEARAFAREAGEVTYKPMTHARPTAGRTMYASPVPPG